METSGVSSMTPELNGTLRGILRKPLPTPLHGSLPIASTGCTIPRPMSRCQIRFTIVRVNRQGDLEIRRQAGWDVVGGLLGDFDKRVVQATGLVL